MSDNNPKGKNLTHPRAKNVSGRSWVWEYVNDDAPSNYVQTTCGQCACLTAASTSSGWVSSFSVRDLCNDPKYRPDLGFFGSHPNRVKTILTEKLRLKVKTVTSLDAIYNAVRQRSVVVVLLDLNAAGVAPTWLAMHWVCVYGLTKYNVFMSNHDQGTAYHKDQEAAADGCNIMPLNNFKKGISAWTCNMGGMGNSGFVVA